MKSRLLVIAMLILTTPGLALAVEPIEEFSGTTIDSSKWNPGIYQGGRLVEVREVSNGELVSKVQGSGEDDPTNQSRFFVAAGAITDVSVDVIITEGSFSGVATGNNGVGPQLEGNFYSEASGDVQAGIRLVYNGTNYTAICAVNSPTGGLNSYTFSYTIQPNTEYNMKIEYDGDVQFTFTINDGSSGAESQTLSGPARVGDAAQSGLSLTTGVLGDSANYGSVTATFDNVNVNSALYDDFSAAALSSPDWYTPEVVRDIRNDELNMNAQNFGSSVPATSDIFLDDSLVTDYLQADATITGDTVLTGSSGDTYADVRVYGSFFNYKYDGSGYDDEDGEVFAICRLRRYAPSGDMEARMSIFTCEDAICNSFTERFTQAFSCSVSLDTPVTLSVKKISDGLIFGCGDETYTYDEFPFPVYASNYNRRILRSRVYSTGGESGYVHAIFDNVYNAEESVTEEKFPWTLMLVPVMKNQK